MTAFPAGRPFRSPFRSSVPVFLRSEKGLFLAGMDLLSVAKNRCSQYPAPAKAGTAFPHRASNTDGWVTLALRHMFLGSCRRSGVVGSMVASLSPPAQELCIASSQGSKEGNHGNHGDGAGGSSCLASEQPLRGLPHLQVSWGLLLPPATLPQGIHSPLRFLTEKMTRLRAQF